MAAIPPVCDFGWRAVGFALPDTEGRVWRLEELKGPKGLLLMFICNHCPYVLAIADKLRAEAEDLKALSIGVAAICSNDASAYPADSFEKMGEFARAHRFSFPYLHDADQVVARAYRAECTPDFFGFNADLELQYRGQLDDSGRRAKPDARRELYPAMRQVAETGHGPEAQTASIGCSIKWKAV
ncbi:MAG: thioredoxin family protein [Rhodobacteraceae bacterium]|nr:thioredoxin family protein [Paracoccaceae bacterium]